MLRKSRNSLVFKANYRKTVDEPGVISPSTSYRTFITDHFKIILPIFQGITSKSLDFSSYLLSFTLFHSDLTVFEGTQMSQNML